MLYIHYYPALKNISILSPAEQFPLLGEVVVGICTEVGSWKMYQAPEVLHENKSVFLTLTSTVVVLPGVGPESDTCCLVPL